MKVIPMQKIRHVTEVEQLAAISMWLAWATKKNTHKKKQINKKINKKINKNKWK